MKFLSVLVLGFLGPFVFAQPGDMPPNAKAGKCYAKCLVEVNVTAIEPRTEKTAYTIYVGDKNVRMRTIYHSVKVDGFGVATERIPIEVPKKIRKIALEDLQEVQYETFYEGREASSGTAFTEWREIVCGGDVTDRLVQEVGDQLRNNGFQFKGADNIMSAEMKAALVEYQRANDLPVGQLDFETLKLLGIDL